MIGLREHDHDNVPPCDSGPDEDGDLIPDACDPCPGLFGSLADEDGDKVGDECDPTPSVACEERVFFDAFHEPSLNWALFSGNWSWSDGDLVQSSLEHVSPIAHYPVMDFGESVVRTSLTVVAFPSSASSIYVGNGASFSSNQPNRGFSCGLHKITTSDEIWLDDLTENVSYLGKGPYNGSTKTPLELAFALDNRADGNIACVGSGESSAGGGAGTVTATASNPSAVGKIMLRSSAHARFHWIDVIARVPCR